MVCGGKGERELNFGGATQHIDDAAQLLLSRMADAGARKAHAVEARRDRRRVRTSSYRTKRPSAGVGGVKKSSRRKKEEVIRTGRR